MSTKNDNRMPMNATQVLCACLAAVILFSQPAQAAETSADEYSQRRAAVEQRDARKRRVPSIPPKDQKLRVIIDTDARNEIDDIWAIALAMLRLERFQIEGF